MGERRTGGIVAAVTLAIAAAFVAIMLLFAHQGITVAQTYAESTTDLYVSEMVAALESFMGEQYALVASGLLDEELSACLLRESAGEDPREVAADLSPLLNRLLVDDELGETYVDSSASKIEYSCDGFWATMAAKNRVDKPISINLVPGCDGTGGAIAYQRALMLGEQQLGIVGVRISTASLSEVMDWLEADEGQQAVCFLEDGTVMFSTSGAATLGTNVFVDYPEIARYEQALNRDATARWQHWVGLEGLLPQDQMLYTIRYNETLDMYLLTTNRAPTIFAEMRMRTTTLGLALIVVMVLLILLLITIVRWYRARVIRAATTDELTGLANRRAFVSMYGEFTESGHATDATLALIDVDRFKQINDGYGHAAGDHALQAVAAEVKAMVGNDGFAGRWGGDEFIGVLRQSQEAARSRVEEMIARVKARVFEEGFSVSVSVGTTDIDVSQPLEKTVEQADDALYVTKTDGRGFLTIYEPGVTPHMIEDSGDTPGSTSQVVQLTDAQPRSMRSEARAVTARGGAMLDAVLESLLEAVRKMVPFVAGGGILIAIAFLIDGASVNMDELSAASRADFGSITPIAAGLRDVGSAAFNFMLPIFAAFFARAMAGDEAFMAGFAGGYLSSQSSAGFAGAICAALVAALVVRLMRNFMEETPASLQRVAPVLLYPVFSLLIMYLLMTFVIEPVASAFDAWLTSWLELLLEGNRVVLGMVCGAMMATDMGGPINKAAYHFGTAAIVSGSPDIMASVMVGGMVPPCGIALCMLLFRNRFTDVERDQGVATLFMGLSFITEGAIPFVLTDLMRTIPACMLGSGVAGACSMLFGCTLMAPHGGIFVLPVVGNAGLYVLALVAGALVTAVVLGLLKRPLDADQTAQAQVVS